jgi:ribokinase
VNNRIGVTVVGSVHSDLIATAPVMPSLGSSVLGTQFTLAPGGKAGNQATQIARLGVPTWLVSSVGADPLGDIISEQLAAAHVDRSYLVRSRVSPTGASTIFAVGGEYASIIFPGAAGTLCNADLLAAAPAFQQSKFVLTQLELGAELALAVMGHARHAGAITVLNASPLVGFDIASLRSELESADILIVNRHEADVLLSHSDSAGRRAVDSALRLCELFQIKVVVVTCGADGSVLVRGEAVVQQTAFPVEVVDSIGAGDAFLGALIAAWMGGAGDARALRSASAAGALAASAAGAHASLPDRQALRSFLREWD